MTELECAIRELERQAAAHTCGDCSRGVCWGRTKRYRVAEKLRTLNALPPKDFLIKLLLASDGLSTEKAVHRAHAEWTVERIMARVAELAESTPP